MKILALDIATKTEYEEWRDVTNYDGYYQVSNKGNVRSLDRVIKNGENSCFIRKGCLMNLTESTGRLIVRLYKNKTCKMFYVHRLVAQEFLNFRHNGSKLVVDHIDNNPYNNNLNNLQIITTRENTSKDKIRRYSKYVGVTYDKKVKKWRSAIQILGKSISLGSFNSEEIASEYYQQAIVSIEYFSGNPKEFREHIKSILK